MAGGDLWRPGNDHFMALFEPRGVVVAGASTHPGKFGFVALHNILSQGYAGEVYATNRDGGTILVAAECADGLPAHGRYRDLLLAYSNPASFLDALGAGGLRTHDQWQVQKQALVLARARVLAHAAGLTAEEIRAAWLEPVDDPTSTLASLVADHAAARRGPCRVAILPEGPQSIAYVA